MRPLRNFLIENCQNVHGFYSDNQFDALLHRCDSQILRKLNWASRLAGKTSVKIIIRSLRSLDERATKKSSSAAADSLAALSSGSATNAYEPDDSCACHTHIAQ